jgi:hypothetical protein
VPVVNRPPSHPRALEAAWNLAATPFPATDSGKAKQGQKVQEKQGPCGHAVRDSVLPALQERLEIRSIDFEKRTILLIWERPSGAETSGLLKALWGEIQSELEFSTCLGSGSSWGALPGGSK